MRSLKRTIISIWIIASLVMTQVPGFSENGSNAELDKLQSQLKSLQNELNDISKSKSEKNALQNKINKKMKEIEWNVKTIEDEIEILNGDITKTTFELENSMSELEKADLNLRVKKALLNKRLRAMYEAGAFGYAHVILGAREITDLVVRIDLVKRIYLQDKLMVESLQKEKIKIEKKKSDVESQKKYLESLGVSKITKQSALNSNLLNLQSQKERVRSDLKALAAQEDELLSDANKITDVIKKLKLAAKYVGGVMSWPAPSYYKISSAFGMRLHPILKVNKMHTGIDINVPYGEDIVAAQAGKVIYADWFGGYGKAIMLDHGGGIVTLYGHTSAILVKNGQDVERGQIIAKCGSTGNSTGPHLHFEVRQKGDYVDPMKWVSK